MSLTGLLNCQYSLPAFTFYHLFLSCVNISERVVWFYTPLIQKKPNTHKLDRHFNFLFILRQSELSHYDYCPPMTRTVTSQPRDCSVLNACNTNALRWNGVVLVYVPLRRGDQDVVVGITTQYGLGRPGFEPRQGRYFRPIETGPDGHPAFRKMGIEFLFLGVKLLGRGADHPLTFCVGVENR